MSRVGGQTPCRPAKEKLPRKNLSQADAGTRTPDPFITSEVLYQLSYVGGTIASYRRGGRTSCR
jgi:hypothetical protein